MGGRPGTGGAGAGTGGGTGVGGGSGACGALVDDMESASGRICQGSGRVGHWYTFKDSNGSTISPDTAQLPALPEMVSPPRDTSHYAMRTHGTRVSYAGMGCMLNNAVIGDPPHGFDGRAYTGVQFFARGSNYAINVTVQNGATVATANGGHCTSTICVGNWTYVSGITASWGLIRVPFSTLAAGSAPFDPSDLWAIEFQLYGDGVYDFWIDDLSFY